jgi:acetyl esterase
MSPQPSGWPPALPGPAPHRVADVQLRGPGGPVGARAYWPAPATPVITPALLVLFPGDGRRAGGLDGADAMCRGICAEVGVVVLSVTYRSSTPEPRAAALADAAAAVHWAADHAAELGADPEQLLVAGVGAGAGLAAAVAQQARDEGWPAIKSQVSIPPGSPDRMWRDLAASLRPALETR